jgi:hypothetical protein
VSSHICLGFLLQWLFTSLSSVLRHDGREEGHYCDQSSHSFTPHPPTSIFDHRKGMLLLVSSRLTMTNQSNQCVSYKVLVYCILSIYSHCLSQGSIRIACHDHHPCNIQLYQNKQLYFFNLHISTRRWRQHVRPKDQYVYTQLHNVLNAKKNTVFYI